MTENTKIDIIVKDIKTAEEWIKGVVSISNALNNPVDLKITAAKTSVDIRVTPGDNAKEILEGFVGELNSRAPGSFASGPAEVTSHSKELKR